MIAFFKFINKKEEKVKIYVIFFDKIV